jgi:hypothetical protein
VNIRLWKAIDKRFRNSDIDGAIRSLEGLLSKEVVGHFKELIGLQFSNSPSSVLSEINKFVRACERSFDLKAVYLEMNGFDINYDRWYFDSFGYEKYGEGLDDSEWLCEWQSEDWKRVRLRGLEKIQKDFEWYHTREIWKDKKYKRAYELALLLVMAKYVSLIQAALGSGKLVKPVPILATAHDFDIIGRFIPSREGK